MQPKVSVIIPVYNAEKNIDRCCRALFSQTLKSLEYIFVDDCSSDNSVAVITHILEQYPKRKPNVKILHQKMNCGVSACRQLGLMNATGEYIIHCDSDDWPELDMYETLYNTVVKEGAETICCDYIVEFEKHSEEVRFPDKYVNRPSFNISPIEGAVWNKLIKKELIDRIGAEFYKDINLGEDFGFVTPCRALSMKNAVLHRPLYHYNQLNPNSITHNYTKKHFLQLVKLAQKTDAFFHNKGLDKNYEREINYLKFQSKAFFLMFREVQDLKLWKNLFPESNKNMGTYNVSLYVKIASWLLVHNLMPIARILLTIKMIVTHH